MELFLLRSLFVTVIFQFAVCEFNGEICKIQRESYGLIPPALPTNFELRSEYLNHNSKAASYMEVYFDNHQSRAKMIDRHQGVEHHRLFDYHVQQVVEYYILHPGMDEKKDIMSHTCVATDMDDSPDEFVFGLLDDETFRPKMFLSSQALRFGGQYQYAYNGTDRDFVPDRGIIVDKYVGCVYDRYLDATINATYLFTNRKVLTSGGTYDGVVSGDKDGGVLSVPAKAEFFGSLQKDQDTVLGFNRSINYFLFQGDSEFKRDTFKIPPYMYCKNFLGREPTPKFPEAFSTRLQVTSFKRDVFGKMSGFESADFEEIYYYREKKLARRDHTPDKSRDAEIISLFDSGTPVRSVYDFMQGLLFITNKQTGRCFFRHIKFGDFFEAAENQMSYVMMGNPEDVFRMHTDDMEYKGHDFARDIECDVWVGREVDKKSNHSYVKETYTSTGGWHNEVDEFSEFKIPITNTIIEEDSDEEPLEGVTRYDFLKFKNAPPKLVSFSVDNCVDGIEHGDFAIRLDVDDESRSLIFKHKAMFLETAQYYLMGISQVLSPLRVQRLQLSQINVGTEPSTLLLFTLVGQPELQTRIPVGARGPSLADAIASLQKIVDTNFFNIRFYLTPKEDEMIVVTAPKGSLYVRTSGGDLTYSQDREEPPQEDPDDVPEVLFEEPLDENEGKGMTSGGLTALAFAMLFIGIGIGIAAMYLYVRKFSHNIPHERIQLSNHPSVEEASTSRG